MTLTNKLKGAGKVKKIQNSRTDLDDNNYFYYCSLKDHPGIITNEKKCINYWCKHLNKQYLPTEK